MSPNPRGVYAVAVILPVCGTVAVALRFYVRTIHRKVGLKADDWTILVALILTWILGITLIVGAAKDSFGNHTKQNPATKGNVITYREQNSSKLHFTAYLVMIPAFGIIKISFLLLYRRVFVGHHFQWYTLGLGMFIACWSIAFFFATAFQCGTKIEYWWTSAKTIQQYCLKTADLELAYGITDIITDLLVLLTPVPLIWALEMSTSRKVGLCGVFVLGLLSTAAGAVRLYQVIASIWKTTTGYRDLIGVLTNVVVWSHVEAGVAVIAACLPTIKPLIHGRAAESVVNSVRSALSLQSMGSSRERRTLKEDSSNLVGGKAHDLESLANSSRPVSANQTTMKGKEEGRDGIPTVPGIPEGVIKQQKGYAVTTK